LVWECSLIDSFVETSPSEIVHPLKTNVFEARKKLTSCQDERSASAEFG
jgi:hypothetical protein